MKRLKTERKVKTMPKKSKIKVLVEKYKKEIEKLHDRIAMLDMMVSDLEREDRGEMVGGECDSQTEI